MDSGWHPDPSRQHELRYWDGARWTEHVVDRGVQSVSPLPPAPGTPAATGGPGAPAPASGGWSPATTQSRPQVEHESRVGLAGSTAAVVLPPQGQVPVSGAAPPASASPSPAPSPSPSPAPAAGPPPSGFPASGPAPTGFPGAGPSAGAGGISGELVDGRFAGGHAPGPALQNQKLLRVRLTEPFLAKQGAMVAYQGELSFHYQGAGMGRVLKRALTGEGLALMRVEGRGDCFLADKAKNVHLLRLENSGISVNGANVLAFSQSLDWNVERVKGAAMATGGLFNTTLRGTGWLAIVTEGDPVVLDAGVAPTFADTDAIVAWSTDLQSSLHSTMSAGALIGRGSGEAVQVVFQGRGFVIVQPSETVKVPGR